MGLGGCPHLRLGRKGHFCSQQVTRQPSFRYFPHPRCSSWAQLVVLSHRLLLSRSLCIPALSPRLCPAGFLRWPHLEAEVFPQGTGVWLALQAAWPSVPVTQSRCGGAPRKDHCASLLTSMAKREAPQATWDLWLGEVVEDGFHLDT